MNQPEYYPVEEVGTCVEEVKNVLQLPTLFYKYGYPEELDKELRSFTSGNVETAAMAYPCVWFMQPFTVERGIDGFWGIVRDAKILVIKDTNKAWKAAERMEENFKPVLYPIVRELFNQFNLSSGIAGSYHRKHFVRDLYYWGEDQKSLLSNPVDVVEMSNIELYINDNQNCKPKNILIR